jgi:hypothetical protein
MIKNDQMINTSLLSHWRNCRSCWAPFVVEARIEPSIFRPVSNALSTKLSSPTMKKAWDYASCLRLRLTLLCLQRVLWSVVGRWRRRFNTCRDASATVRPSSLWVSATLKAKQIESKLLRRVSLYILLIVTATLHIASLNSSSQAVYLM